MNNKTILLQKDINNESLQVQEQEYAHDNHIGAPADALSSLTTRATQSVAKIQICISLLGEMKTWLDIDGKQIELPIKSNRRQELLAYLATLAPERSKRVASGRILTDVFEHIAPTADVSNLRLLFQKHT